MPTQSKSHIRRALLAKIHIAAKECGLDDATYREILFEEFGVRSAGKLSVRELGSLVERFESKGWQPKGRNGETGKRRAGDQAEALKERIGQMVIRTDFTEARLRGLVRRICGVEDLRWVKDAVRLRELVAVLGDILKREPEKAQGSAR